jgi:hypothetical protein
MNHKFPQVVALTAALLTMTGQPSVGQDLHDPDKVIELLTEAVRTGDARQIAELSTAQVEIDLGEGTSLYSRDQSRFVLMSFFKDNPPSDFDVDDVTVLQTHCTAQGTFSSSNSDRKRNVLVRLLRSSEGWRLKELHIISPIEGSDQLPEPMMLQRRRQ